MTGADGLGASLCIYNSHTHIGRRGCHWLENSNPVFNVEESEEVLQFTLKIRVSDPKTRVIAQFSTDGTECALIIPS